MNLTSSKIVIWENKIPIAIHLFVISAVYLFSVREFLLDTFGLGYDNAIYMYPGYLYYAESIRHGFGLPRWYPYAGGIDTGIASMNMISMVPHRIVGYLLNTLLPLRPIILYKINVVLGMVIIGIGWWLFLYRLIGSRLSASVGTLALLLSGSARIIFHMEQDLATMAYIPWLMLALIQIKKQFSYTLVFAVLFGYALSTHYPFHGLLTIIFIFIAFMLTGKFNYLFAMKPTFRQTQLLLLACTLCVLSLIPSLYISQVKDNFSSSLRNDRVLKKVTFEDYQKMGIGGSSVTSNYYLDVLKPLNTGDQNGIAFKLTRAHLVLAIIGIFYFRFSITVLIVLGLSLWASLGLTVHHSLPYYLFKIHFPFIAYFRQWYHFVTMVLFCLSFLVALGFAIVLGWSQTSLTWLYKLSERKETYEKIGIGLFTLLLTLWMYNSSRPAFLEYAKIFYDTSGKGIGYLPKFDKKLFLENLRSNLFGSPLTLFMYTSWWDLNSCPEITTPSSTIKPPFSTRLILNDANLSDALKSEVFNQFCNENIHHAVIASIPDDKIKSSNVDILDLTTKGIADNPELLIYNNHNYNGRLTPSSLHLNIDSQNPHFIVVPYNYKLRLKVYLDQHRVDTYPVYNGAMTGVFVPAGSVKLDYFMPFSIYQISLWIQGLLFLFIIVFVVRSHKPKIF